PGSQSPWDCRPRRLPRPSWSSRGQCRSPSPCRFPLLLGLNSDGAGRPAPSRIPVLREIAPATDRLDDVDLDRLRLHLFGLWKLHFQDAVSVSCLHLVSLNGHRQLHAALELPVDALATMRVLVLELTICGALALQGQQVAGDRQRYVLLSDARKLEAQN